MFGPFALAMMFSKPHFRRSIGAASERSAPPRLGTAAVIRRQGRRIAKKNGRLRINPDTLWNAMERNWEAGCGKLLNSLNEARTCISAFS